MVRQTCASTLDFLSPSSSSYSSSSSSSPSSSESCILKRVFHCFQAYTICRLFIVYPWSIFLITRKTNYKHYREFKIRFSCFKFAHGFENIFIWHSLTIQHARWKNRSLLPIALLHVGNWCRVGMFSLPLQFFFQNFKAALWAIAATALF